MIVALIAAILAAVAPVEAAHLSEQPKKHKVVYHLNEPGVDKARFVLRNIQNHIDGVGGMKNVEAIELVVHGPALRTFVTNDMNPDIKRALDELKSEGVGFGACGNTMKAFNITLEQLPAGARALPQGGGVRGGGAQEQGYVYIRP